MLDKDSITIEDRLFITNNLDEILSILKQYLKPIQHGENIEFNNIINELNRRTYHTILSVNHLLKSENIIDVIQPILILLRASTLDLINIIYIFSYFEENIRLDIKNDNYKYVAIQLYIKQYEKLKNDFKLEIELLRLPSNPESIKREKIKAEIKKYETSISDVEKIIQNCESLLSKLNLEDKNKIKVDFSTKDQIKHYCKKKSFFKYNTLYHFYTKYSKIDHFGAITKSVQLFTYNDILLDIIWISINFSQGFIYNLKMIEDERLDFAYDKLKKISELLEQYGDGKFKNRFYDSSIIA